MLSDDCDYLLGEELTFAQAPEALARALSLQATPVRRADRRFYDTFDGRLRAAGFQCVREDGRILLLDGSGLGQEVASVALPDSAERFLAIELPEGAMRNALVPVVDVRALQLLVHLHSRFRTLAVLDHELKTVVRLVVEQPAVVLAGRLPVSLPGRIRLAPVRGYDKQLTNVRQTLEQRLSLRRAPRSLLDEAVRAAGGVPGGVSSKIDVELDHGMRADLAAGIVLRRLLEVMRANLPGTLADVDAEYLHDFRVAMRRTRAVQRELRDVFEAARLAQFRGDFRWLQRATGRSRDLDVYVLEFDDFRAELPGVVRKDLDPLLAVLRRRRVSARHGMVRVLRSERAVALLDEWGRFVDRLGAVPDIGGALADGGPAAGMPIELVAGTRIAHVYRAMVRMGRAIDDSSAPEAYHELRKKGKELRYLLELFGAPLYPDEVVKPMVRALKALQDTLGRHQDREVQVATLRSLGDDVAELQGGAAGLMAMGMLIERLDEQVLAARAEFASRFEAFASKSQRTLVKDTFG